MNEAPALFRQCVRKIPPEHVPSVVIKTNFDKLVSYSRIEKRLWSLIGKPLTAQPPLLKFSFASH